MSDMTHPFKEGDTVKCIDAEERPALVEGEEYTISETYFGDRYETPMVRIAGNTTGYFASRFEALPDPNAAMIAADGPAEEDPVQAVDTADGEALSAAIGRTP